MPAASTVFFNLPELLQCLGEAVCPLDRVLAVPLVTVSDPLRVAFQIRSRRQLATLRLVNKRFNAAFTPFLYREFKIQLLPEPYADTRIDKPETLAWPMFMGVMIMDHVGHIRSLAFHAALPDYILTKMLPKMPLLERFSLRQVPQKNPHVFRQYGRTDSEQRWAWASFDTARTNPDAVLRALHKSCPRIKAIDIRCAMIYTPDQREETDQEWLQEQLENLRVPSLALFSGLEELTLNELYEELPCWMVEIIRVLEKSPGLRKLELSLSEDAICRYLISGQRDKFLDFFERLCNGYGETGAAPLNLRSLHVGTGLYPPEGPVLQKLTNLAGLQEVHIENKWVYGMDFDFRKARFDAFGPANCPNLRRLSVANDTSNLDSFLYHNSAFARNLAVSRWGVLRAMRGDRFLQPIFFSHRHQAHRRMLSLRLLPSDAILTAKDGEPWDPGSEEAKAASAKARLERLVDGDEGALEGLALELPETPKGDGFEYLDLLVAALRRLANLKQLAVLPATIEEAYLRIRSQEHWREVASILAAGVPRLRYIRVYGLCWRVWRMRDNTIRLEELDDDEIAEVELFGLVGRSPRICWDSDVETVPWREPQVYCV
jgi:hypothetical protein